MEKQTDLFGALRSEMVDSQLIPRGVSDVNVLQAMREIPRHLFVSSDMEKRAHDDGPLSIGEGQTISQPFIVAHMTQLLELEQHHKVLEIGTGSGYQAAILRYLCSNVFTVERIETLSERAREILKKIDLDDIHFFVGDGTLGWLEHAPYDRIIVTAAAPCVSSTLLQQLQIDGKIVVPVGDRYSQTMVRVTKTASGEKTERFYGCRFVPLIGQGDSAMESL